MHRLLLSLLLAAALVAVAVARPAEAAGRRRAAGPNRQAAIGAYGRSVYPQYYGGFHARHLQNIGIPTGDIGLRGNGLMTNPW